MGERRVEAIKAAYAAWNRGDWDSFVMQGYHEDAVWEVPEGDISLATMRGRGTFAQAWEAWESEEEWNENLEWSVEHIEELDHNRVLVEAVVHARGARSGIEVTRRTWHLYEYRGPKVARVRWFDSRQEATAVAAGNPRPGS